MGKEHAVGFLNLIKSISDKQVGNIYTPGCYGYIKDVIYEGGAIKDIVLSMDILKQELSWKLGEFSVADHLLLKPGDRVIVLPIGTGASMEFAVVARLNTCPAVARIGNSDGYVDVTEKDIYIKTPNGNIYEN